MLYLSFSCGHIVAVWVCLRKSKSHHVQWDLLPGKCIVLFDAHIIQFLEFNRDIFVVFVGIIINNNNGVGVLKHQSVYF